MASGEQGFNAMEGKARELWHSEDESPLDKGREESSMYVAGHQWRERGREEEEETQTATHCRGLWAHSTAAQHIWMCVSESDPPSQDFSALASWTFGLDQLF